MNIKSQIQELISLGNTEEALKLLEQLTSDAVLLQSRYNGAIKQYSMGIIDFSEWSRTQAQINYAALEMMNSVKDINPKPEPQLIQTTQPKTMNKLAQVNQIFLELGQDIDGLNFSKDIALGYIYALNTVFEMKMFSQYADPLTSSDWDSLLSAQRTERAQSVMTSLRALETKLKEKAKGFQEKMNTSVSVDESIQIFFDRPSIALWKNLSEQLSARFADAALFGPGVQSAFNVWKQKLDGLTDGITFPMDFNFDHRSDFGSFLQANLKPKNFNYQ
jgi:Effector-associated domain 11